MNIKEILDCMNDAMMELEYVKFEDIPDDLQKNSFKYIYYCRTLV